LSRSADCPQSAAAGWVENAASWDNSRSGFQLKIQIKTPLEFSFAGGLHLLKNLVHKIFWTVLGLWLCGLVVPARADSFQLIDGSSVSGSIVTFNDNGVMFRMENDSYTNLLWTRFSQDALAQLGKNPKIKPLVEPFIEPPLSARAKKAEITIQEASRLELPAKQSLLLAFFSSSIGFVILLLLYVANVYAGYEIAVVRVHPIGLVVGVSAVLPILGPIIFLCTPTQTGTPKSAPSHSAVKSETYAMPGAEGEIRIAEASWRKEPAVQEPQIFQRGQFMFNRRFIETKFSNFFTSIRRDADKDLLFIVKTTREELIVQRITRITSSEVRFEVGQGSARREVTVPFADIQEIQLKHKDA
jgi:hypothetical protein